MSGTLPPPPIMQDITIRYPDGKFWRFEPSWISWFITLQTSVNTGGGGGGGTVTSVGIADAVGITWAGSPITGSGVFTPTLSANLQLWSGIAPSSKADTFSTGDIVQGTGVSLTGTLINRLFGAGNVTINASLKETYETVSKNLESGNAVIAYSSGVIDTITYTVATGTIVKTFNFTGPLLTSIVLSGDTPGGIDLTKTLSYTLDELTGISYS